MLVRVWPVDDISGSNDAKTRTLLRRGVKQTGIPRDRHDDCPTVEKVHIDRIFRHSNSSHSLAGLRFRSAHALATRLSVRSCGRLRLTRYHTFAVPLLNFLQVLPQGGEIATKLVHELGASGSGLLDDWIFPHSVIPS